MAKKLKFGKAFFDQLEKISLKSPHFQIKGSGKEWQESLIVGSKDDGATELSSAWRKIALLVVIIFAFSVLSIRLFRLQIIEGSYNRELADSNRIQVKIIHAPRGVIYDRNGKILAQNEPGFRLIEGTDSAQVKTLTRDEALNLEVSNDAKYESLEIDHIRSYPLSEKTAHVIGFVSEIGKDELKNLEGYKLGDKIGRGGIEESYEKILKGIDGGEIIEVDARGKRLRTLRKKDAIAGQNLYLTIDADLQKVVYQRLEETVKKNGFCCGAVIVQDPNSGQILALVSIPSFNPADVAPFLQDPASPLLNRGIAGVYPPGSTFKIASAIAGLASGKITAQTQYDDPGFIFLGPYKFTNWFYNQYGKTEGSVDLIKAIKRSNDTYFYRLAQAVGEKVLAGWAKKLGMGGKLGIDLPGEVDGVVPDNDWKVKNFNQIWFPGDTLHMSIGQGFVLTTPLQIANLTSIVASLGKQYPPYLGLKITNQSGKTIKEFKFDPSILPELKKEDLEIIREGLALVPQNGGTAWPFFNFPISTAGKTGTAEFGDPKGKTHAWYTSYAPVDDPKIVVTVLLEGAGEGSTVASPIAKEIFRWYFSQDKSNLIKDISPIASDSAKTLGE